MRYPPQIQFLSSSSPSTIHVYLDSPGPSNITTKRQATTDSSFHKSSHLATELRLQIWEAACCHIVTTDTYSGLQYIGVRVHGGETQAYSSWSQPPGQSNNGRKNRSAYLYDSGLWKACKESKQIIAKHTALCKFAKIQERGVDRVWKGTYQLALADETTDIEIVCRLLGQYDDQPFAEPIRSPQGGKQCPMLASPYTDIFCIQVDDWTTLRNVVGAFPVIIMPFGMWGLDGKEHPVRSWMNNIALEYEPSWVTDLPHPLFNLNYENSARGYLAYLLRRRLSDGVRCQPEKWFWIIDKEAKWFASPPPPYGQQYVYWDCDAEYVEANWDNARRCNVSDDEADDAAGFIHRIDRFCCRARDLYPWDERRLPYGPQQPTPWLYRGDLPLKKIAKLLVRRDNQVKPATKGCKGECYTNGWCICSNKERKYQEEKGLNKFMICYVWLRYCSDRERRDTFSYGGRRADNSDRSIQRQSAQHVLPRA